MKSSSLKKEYTSQELQNLVFQILNEELAFIREAEADAQTAPAQTQDTATTEAEPEQATTEKKATTWEKIKYALSKLGDYKVGGKFFGRKKTRADAEEKIKTILAKESNKFIRELDAKLKQELPGFPNNKIADDFLDGILGISSCYDSIVEACKKGEFNVDAANEIINDLRDYVKKILDVDLKTIYAGVDENQELEITEEGLKRLDEKYGLIEKDFNNINEDRADDIRAQNLAARKTRSTGDDKQDYQSTTISTLKSNKLPLTIGGVGVSLGAFSWLVNTEWFKDLYTTITPGHWTQDIVTHTSEITPIKEGEGVYKLLGRVTNHKLDGNSSPSEFTAALKQIGGGDAHKGVDLLCQKGGVMMKPQEAAKGLHDFLNHQGDYKNMNDLFHGAASGTGKLTPIDTTLYGTISGTKMVSLITKMIPGIFIKGSAKVGAGYAAAKGFGAILGPIGIGLITTGVLVKLMRVKGLKQSRAATLNSLYQSLRNLPGGKVVTPEGEVDKSIKVPPEGASSGTGKGTATAAQDKGAKPKQPTAQAPEGSEDDIYNSLKNMFKYLVNNRNILGGRSKDFVGLDASRLKGEKGKKGTKKAQAEPQKQTEPETIEPSPETTLAAAMQLRKKRLVNAEVSWKNSKGGKSTGTVVKIDDQNEDKVIVQREDGKKFRVLIKNLIISREKTKKKAAVKENLSEATNRFSRISSSDLRSHLEKGLSFNKLRAFENVIKMAEAIRNKVRVAKIENDPEASRILARFKSNPLMRTDFKALFDIQADNQKDMDAYKGFIDNLFIKLYSSNYRRGGSMIAKMGTLGGGNLNALKEASYSDDDPNKAFLKDAQSRELFTKNFINFLQDGILLFQHLYQKKRNA